LIDSDFKVFDFFSTPEVLSTQCDRYKLLVTLKLTLFTAFDNASCGKSYVRTTSTRLQCQYKLQNIWHFNKSAKFSLVLSLLQMEMTV